MKLPPVVVLTDRTQTRGRPLVDVVADALAGGVEWIVLRDKDLARAERVALADDLRVLVRAAGGTFSVASDPGIEADGIHLAAADPFPVSRPPLVGRSCHGLDEVRAAEAEGCDYVTLSPIFETGSKPGYGPALGLAGLRDVVDEVAIPVYALGGIDASIISACHRAGAAGVAIMGAAMRDPVGFAPPISSAERPLGDQITDQIVRPKILSAERSPSDQNTDQIVRAVRPVRPRGGR